jgi:hypothetical protein
MSEPIRIHPQNPKLFEFRAKPLVLLTATEHYGAVMNRPFRFERYLVDAAEKGMTLTRLFTLFRELQTPINPYSTCKPESPDYVAPFLRTGPGRALDGELKFDLDRPNPEFFDRLHGFLSLASELGIIVELVLFSNTYNPTVWSLNPLNAKNNINDLEEIEWPDYLSRRHPKLLARQLAHLRKLVAETNRYDNVIYEICNEPGGNAPGVADAPSCDEVNEWLATMIQAVREVEQELPNRHLIVGQEAFVYEPWEQPADRSFRTQANDGLDYDVVNIHPLPNSTYGGQRYDLGVFMSKQLALRAMRDYCLAAYGAGKPLNLDEDNVASQYKDVDAWTIHRKRAWVTLMSGGHYDYIDFSIINYCETGTPESQRHIRNWMKHLSTFIHSLDLARARPLPEVIQSTPPHTVAAAFGVPGKQFGVYLADERELPAARDLPAGVTPDPAVGAPIAGALVLDLPAGDWTAHCFDPKNGCSSPAVSIQGGAQSRIALPPFVHDLVVRIEPA